jgi:hypothetical protein
VEGVLLLMTQNEKKQVMKLLPEDNMMDRFVELYQQCKLSGERHFSFMLTKTSCVCSCQCILRVCSVIPPSELKIQKKNCLMLQVWMEITKALMPDVHTFPMHSNGFSLALSSILPSEVLGGISVCQSQAMADIQWELAQHCVVIQASRSKWYVYRPDDTGSQHCFPLRYLRLCNVCVVDDTFAWCTSGLPQRTKYPCQHLYAVTGEAQPQMFAQSWTAFLPAFLPAPRGSRRSDAKDGPRACGRICKE